MARRKKKATLADMPGQDDPRAGLDGGAFLAAATPVLGALKNDLLARATESPAVTAALQARHALEREQERTADPFKVWRERLVEQVAASWLLSCVFVRVLEDRGLLGRARIAGPGAADSQKLFFEVAPSLSERDYLRTVFTELAHFPAVAPLFDRRHNLTWLLAPSAEGARALMALFRAPTAEAPAFRFGAGDTRFLGDLYQDLDEGVRKRFALLQTPRFVERFILDRSLEPALDTFGLDATTVIDPTCGSGHFLLGAFDRLLERRLQAQPGLSPRQGAALAIDAIYGADINPYAVAIARFRLTLAFLEAGEFDRLDGAPQPPLHLCVADSLLHNPQLEQLELGDVAGQGPDAWKGDLYAVEDAAELRDVLYRRHTVVVGNPPYITVKDKVLRDRYRAAYPSASGKYSVAVPFTERFFQLAVDGGQVGMITANSFMKREFGKKLIQDYLPTVNLNLIVNTSGAYIPGHGTPTVLIFGTSEAPVEHEVLTVLASRGEPTTPEVPEEGQVWSSIAAHWHEVGFENDYISVARVQRANLGEHPWSLAGGGATELKALLEERAEKTLGDLADSIGIASFTLEDDVFLRTPEAWRCADVGEECLRPMVIGEAIRDWSLGETPIAFFPYDENLDPWDGSQPELRAMWPWRNCLANNKLFGDRTKVEGGLNWYEFGRLTSDKLRTPLTIAFAFVATHNHFVLDRGGKVFNRTAPIIKLPPDATEDDHLALLAYLNSSTACFWMKQVIHKKSSASQKHHTDPARAAYEFAGTALEGLPLPPIDAAKSQLVAIGRELDRVSDERSAWLEGTKVYDALMRGEVRTCAELDSLLEQGWTDFERNTKRAVYLQEEIDWLVYDLFGIAQDVTVRLSGEADLGSRPFEVESGYDAGVSERAASGRADQQVPITPAWSPRSHAIPESKELSTLETREFKRMWRLTERNVDQHEYRDSLPGDWVVAALEELLEASLTSAVSPTSAREMFSGVRQVVAATSQFLPGAEDQAVASLIEDEAVPYLAALRFKPSGLDKHEAWQHTWALQRQEDAGEEVGDIPVPPKYKSTDFRKGTYWRLRGKLDVPKERFISYPGCESDEDGEPLYGWAGWDHAQRAQALAQLYVQRKNEGWPADRLTPMLAGLLELVPWVKQWHNDPNPDFGGLRLGDYYADFIAAQSRELSLTEADLQGWRPPDKKRGRSKKRG